MNLFGRSKNGAWLALLGPIAAFTAHAEVYLTPEQAAAALFPGSKMHISSVTVTKKDFETLKGFEREKPTTLKAWTDDSGNVLYVDQVIGKHELIKFAVGLNAAGKITGVEILEYREAYGGQIRNAKWRSQFLGKGPNDKIKVDEDIQNISGATLSSSHVTDGIRKIVAIHDLVKSRR